MCGRAGFLGQPDGLSRSRDDAASDRLAAALARRGISRGAHVILLMDDCWQAAVGQSALLKAQALPSPVDPAISADALIAALTTCQAQAILTHEHLIPVVARAIVEVPSIKLTVVVGSSETPPLASVARFEDMIAEEATLLEAAE